MDKLEGFSDKEKRAMMDDMKDYLNAKRDLKALEKYVHDCEVILCKFLVEHAKGGGRIRTTHDKAPKISRHDHILRMVDPREGKDGRLLEIFCDRNEDGTYNINTHSSRGALVTKDTEEKKDGTVSKISEFSTKRFQKLAKAAKVAQNHYESNKNKSKEEK